MELVSAMQALKDVAGNYRNARRFISSSEVAKTLEMEARRIEQAEGVIIDELLNLARRELSALEAVDEDVAAIDEFVAKQELSSAMPGVHNAIEIFTERLVS